MMKSDEEHEAVQHVKQLGARLGLEESRVDVIMERVLCEMDGERRTKIVRVSAVCRLMQWVWKVLRAAIVSVVLFAFLYLILVCHNPTQKFVTRHTQSLIYPVMRWVRFFSLPVINRYPFMTDWYEESCLVSNPYFRILDLDCWPCQQVRDVVELTGLKNFSEYYYHSGVPFVAKDVKQQEINFESLKEMYISNCNDITKGAPRLKSSDSDVSTVEDLFLSESGQKLILQDDFHVQWKINRAIAVRVVRKVFQRPYFIPSDTEVSIQRYIYIDGPKSEQYTLPLTEFANVWVAQGTGERLILLLPSQECKKFCTVVSIVLQPRDVLFYNWQFWRPKSLPVDYKNISITYVGSFY